jgi:hypothetical protein
MIPTLQMDPQISQITQICPEFLQSMKSVKSVDSIGAFVRSLYWFIDDSWTFVRMNESQSSNTD